MAFSTEFKKYLTKDQQNSTMAGLIQSIGNAAERAIVQEVSNRLASYQDISLFTVDMLSSWLSFLRVSVRGKIPATGQVQVTCHCPEGENVVIPAGATLLAYSNIRFYTLTSTVFGNNETKSISVTNAHAVPFTNSEYNEYFKIRDADITLDGLEVYLDNQPIAPVSEYEESLSAYNGYFATYYDNTLYIKIYEGASTTSSTPSPGGHSLTGVYYTCDGIAGNILENTIVSFADNYTSSTSSTTATFDFSNEPFENGQDAPTRSELVNSLRRALFVQKSVTTVPEYETYYKSRPEVGDVLVLSDEKRYLNWVSLGGDVDSFVGVSSGTTNHITNILQVYLLDKAGNVNLNTGAIEEDLALYKDIAFIEYKSSPEVKHFIKVRYLSSSDDTQYPEYVNQSIYAWYTPAIAFNSGISLFGDLNLDSLRAVLLSQFSPKGLQIIPYHHNFGTLPANFPEKPQDYSLNIQAYIHETCGGYAYIVTSDGDIVYDKKNDAGHIESGTPVHDYQPLSIEEGYGTDGLVHLYRVKRYFVGTTLSQSREPIGSRSISVYNYSSTDDVSFETTGNYASFSAAFINLLRVSPSSGDLFINLANPAAPFTKDLEVHCNFAVESPQSFPVGLSTGHRVLFGVKVEKYE